MFCQNCGAKNNDESIFCEYCGAKLEKPMNTEVQQEQPMQQTQPMQQEQSMQQTQPMQQEQPMQQAQYEQPKKPAQPKKPVSKLAIAIGVEIVALVALVIGFFKIGQSVYGPEKVAEKFFVEVANHNFEEAYKVLDVDENDFINESAFENAKCNVELNKVTDYKVKKVTGKEDERTVQISYKVKGKSAKRNYDISINKQNSKNMLFFENWEISPDSMIVNDFYVCVPTGTEVTVDGVKLGKDYLKKSESDEYSQYYEIPEMFAGEHQIVVTQAGMQEVRKLVDTDSEYGFYLYSMSPSKEAMEEVLDTAMADFETIYTAAAAKKDFSEVADMFSSEEDYQKDAEDEYESIVENLTDDAYSTLNKATFTKVEGEAGEGYVTADQACISVVLKVDYTTEYTENWFGEVTNGTYDDYLYVYMNYIYEDGAWVLAEFDRGYLYY